MSDIEPASAGTSLPVLGEIPSSVEDIHWPAGSVSHTADWFRLHHRDLIPILYVESLGWHVWNGMLWHPDPESIRVRQILTNWVRRLHRMTIGQSHNKHYTDRPGYIGEIMQILQVSCWTTVAFMDAVPSLLNTQAGILDLESFELGKHDHRFNMTRITESSYSGRVSPLWEGFLEQVLPDPEVREYLQRLVGLALLGHVPEHTLPILKGVGANGKSTFINAVVHALGTYAHTAEPTLFMTNFADANAASPALVQLRGKRFVATVETEDGKKLASSLVKHITGGDSITARALHRMPITFKPSHSAFMATNFTPEVDGSDQALFRRLKIIPFDVVIPKDKRDPTLGQRLEEDADSVLTWAVEGLKAYHARGLDEPAAIAGATTEYQHESDAVGQFINEQLDVGTGTVTVHELNALLQDWQSDLDPKHKISAQKLGRAFKERGISKGMLRIDGKVTRVWNGVSLKT